MITFSLLRIRPFFFFFRWIRWWGFWTTYEINTEMNSSAWVFFFFKSLLKYKKINRNDSIKILNKTGQKYKSWQRQTYFFFPCTIGPLGTLYTHGLRSFKEIKLSVQVCVMTACCLLPLFIFSWSSSPETQGSSEWSGCSSSPDPPRTRWQHSPASCYCTDGMTLGMKGHYVCQINTTQHTRLL